MEEGGPPISGAASERVIRRYPNRRLYDTRSSSYVSLAELKRMVLQFEPFVVTDSKSGADVTRATLLQILLEAESAGLPMFSEAALAHLIRLYGLAPGADLRALFESQFAAMAQAQRRWSDLASAGAGVGVGVGALGSDWLKPWVAPSPTWMSGWPVGQSEARGAAAEPKPSPRQSERSTRSKPTPT